MSAHSQAVQVIRGEAFGTSEHPDAVTNPSPRPVPAERKRDAAPKAIR